MIKNRTIIIAEIGVNHNGSLSLAKKLIINAKNSGADVVKFQLYKTSELIRKETSLAKYQKKNTNFNNQYEMLKKYELKYIDAIKLIKFCKKNSIDIAFSVFNETYSKIFNEDYVSFIKIPSGEINNIFLIKNILKTRNKNLIISTGMASLNEISKIISEVKKVKKINISLLHCISNYPTKLKDMNLRMINILKDRFKLNIGLSDHSASTSLPAFAVFAGASIIEKHFTLDKNLNGPDHKSSLNPKQFKRMVSNIRKAELINGSSEKKIINSELDNKKLVRKVLVAKKNINKGDSFNFNNLTAMRSDSGTSVSLYKKLINKKSKINLKIGDLVEL